MPGRTGRRAGGSLGLVVLLAFGCSTCDRSRRQPSGERASALAATAFMARLMDRFHDRFAVYDDVSSAGNHFQTYAKMPSPTAGASMNGSWSVLPHSGATCIRAEFTDRDAAGMYFMNGVLPDGETTPRPNFGELPDAGINMSDAESLTFWARGERGGEEMEFFVAGVGRDATSGVAKVPYPDSSPRQPPAGQTITLTTDWRQYRISLVGLDLSYVLGGFGWWADSVHNSTGAVFYVDDIQFNLSPAARDARLAHPASS